MPSALIANGYARVQRALGWRLRKLLGDEIVDRTFVKIAKHWRPILRKPVFIGITGSAGKTTTKELLLGVLSHRRQGIANPASLNVLPEVAKTILRLRPTHDFCVAEMGAPEPGALNEPLALFQPNIGIVTVIGNDHWSAYNSREEIAKEKTKLIASLPPTGTAVLNADDDLVLAMARNTTAKVITYGISPKAELRAEHIHAAWPDRLEFTLTFGNERVHIRTQLCGSHWIPAVLSAIGGGLAAGMSLTECADGIASVAPFEGRMQPVMNAGGVTFIRDDYKAPLWTIDACFAFMKSARAKRRIIVIGELSDVVSKKERKYERAAKIAQDIVDMTIFVGPWATSTLKTRKPGAKDSLRVFGHVRDAAEFINGNTTEGDLVLLKGTNKQNHLIRIIMARTGNIACWRDDCARDWFCNECPDRNNPSGLPLLMDSATVSGSSPRSIQSTQRRTAPDEQVIIGLGNPESKYAGTPHNIGYEVVDRIAVSNGLVWETIPDGWIAHGSFEDRCVCLVKINMPMNLIGAGLKRLSENLAFGPEQCILVYDDLDLPLGSIKIRMSGSAGGHRGVASILEAFQSDAFRRVKVGVGQEDGILNRLEYVVTAFSATKHSAVEQAILSAEEHLIKFVTIFPKAP